MRHHSHYVSLAVQYAGDVTLRPVRIIEVAEEHAVFRLQFVERVLIGDVAALSVRDRDAQNLAALRRARERRSRCFDAQVHSAADEPEAAIADQRTGKESGLDENLEPIANSH